ncbi:MAG: 5-(carboxyamino)imidazole ribonucleotide synthase [Woeseia sp.]
MKKIGVIGAGQLGLMLGQAGRGLGLEFTFLDPASGPPAASAGAVLSEAFDSEGGLLMLSNCDVVTFEFENVPVAALEVLSQKVPVFPPPTALQHAQDRLNEKRLFESLNIPVPAWHAVSSPEDLDTAIRTVGLPLVLKTRRFGYDGKGQYVARTAQEAQQALQQAGDSALIAEEWVEFEREVSMIGARSESGETVVYPMTDNEHANGILRVSRAPADGPGIARRGAQYLEDLMRRLEYVGVLALEMFVAGDRLLANEFAPRVHNSGHWTIEGSRTSQFENHLRAILGLPLGATAAVGHSGMINLIGSLPDNLQLLQASGFHLHDYRKEARPGRKLGHVTIVAPDPAARDQELHKALKTIGIQ